MYCKKKLFSFHNNRDNDLDSSCGIATAATTLSHVTGIGFAEALELRVHLGVHVSFSGFNVDIESIANFLLGTVEMLEHSLLKPLPGRTIGHRAMFYPHSYHLAAACIIPSFLA